ncbi:MAG: hypothetical protein IPK60_05940 [Sandaracinaceae bacterium]|nr:hypothetical protein [Sandaracinaceae bacterium]
MTRSLKHSFAAALLSTVVAMANASPARAVTLVPGDIAIVGTWADSAPGAKSVAFVTLVDLDIGTVISFTDNGAHTDGTFRASEGIATYMVTAPIAAGSVVVVGAGVSGGFNLSTEGDQVFAFQGTFGSAAGVGTITGTLLWGMTYNGSGVWEADGTDSNTSGLPTSIASQSIAVPEFDNTAYMGPTSGTRAYLLASIMNAANWTGSDLTQPAFPTAFTLTTGSGIGTDCGDASECASGFCSDGVCCATNCGDDPHDCQACATGAGAASNGTCGAAGITTICREALSACDIAENCNGTDTTCPADVVEPAATPCLDGTVCNGSEQCDDVGECMPGTALDCDDSDECTAESCDPTFGCVHTPIDGCGDLDGGVPVDSGTLADAGSSDLGVPADAGAGRDSGVPSSDASIAEDLGMSEPPTPRASGCSCDTVSGSTSFSYGALCAMLAAVGLVARRRRHR